MLAKSTVHARVASGNRLRAHLDHDEVARRHLAQAQIHLDLAFLSMDTACAGADIHGERLAARVAITELYRALNRGPKRGRR